MVDLRGLAVTRLGEPPLAEAGLKRLGVRVLGKELEKLKVISYSEWDKEVLSEAQIEYACLDAFVSFELGRVLRAASFGR
ncbi:hypothetical protein MLD38_004517 [Melastoma candidum]|nr:hypothetical protein MLD38_004517 [Melastoma candidum]